MTFLDNNGKIVITGVFTEFDKMNRNNGRIYPRELYGISSREYEINKIRKLRMEKIEKINKINE